MKLFKPTIELVVIRDIFNPSNNMSVLQGDNIEPLLKEAFGNSLSRCVKLYHGDLSNDVTPTDIAGVDRLHQLSGRIYAVVKPMGPETWIAIGIGLLSIAVSYALMPSMPTQNGGSAAPSPNNALAARTNKQRLGGRIPDIFGTVWSVPDLQAPTYSVYIDHKEVEMSYYAIGRGKYHVYSAHDDTTPIGQVFGSSVLVFNPNDTLDDTPAFQFGSALTAEENLWARMAAKRYTSVNGQTLAAPDNYLQVKTVFRNPNIIEVASNANPNDYFAVGKTILVEGADNLMSANMIQEGEPPADVKYTLNGQYIVESITGQQVKLVNPASVASDWNKLTTNTDFTSETDKVALSRESDTFWQGWFYTDLDDHDGAYINITAPNGLYDGEPSGRWRALRLFGKIESQIVDNANNPIAGTAATQNFQIQSPNSENMSFGGMQNGYQTSTTDSLDNKIRSQAATTVAIVNPNFSKGKRIRIRVSRTSNVVKDSSGGIVDELKIKDFYGIRKMSGSDYPMGRTTVYSKTLATEGALSLKERKLRLLVQRYVTDAITGELVLSNRADDIIRHIATDAKIGNLTTPQIDMTQIKAEVDKIIAYFGTPLCEEFCHTFDDDNLSAEETLQIVAKAVFSQLKRQGNKLLLDFERMVPASVAIFNSHNILPGTFKSSQSFGVINNYDGSKVEYIDPVDDAVVTLSYPYEGLANPHEDKLVGVRNKIQAHMHMMRMYYRDRYTFKSCEFTAGDESNVVVRTNRVTVANQRRADITQGSVDSIEMVGADIVMHTTDPIELGVGTHTLFIQTINNGVESISVTARDDYSVTLARLPSGEVSAISDYNSVQAVYQIVKNEDSIRDAYLVTKKSPSEGMSNSLTCTNYDDRFYSSDKDYVNGLIALN